jgi:adenine C2-methylase RlmN of 23S rRNA A2503 and tRNA A37
MIRRKNALILEDNKIVAFSYKSYLSEIGGFSNIYVARTVEETTKFQQKGSIDLFLIDLSLPDGSGINFIDNIRRQGIFSPVVVITNHTEDELLTYSLELSKNLNVRFYLQKPVEHDAFIEIVKKALMSGTEAGYFIVQESQEMDHDILVRKFIMAVDSKGKNSYVESVSFQRIYENSHTPVFDDESVCLSTATYCPIGCIFCATGHFCPSGRNLYFRELVSQNAFAKAASGFTKNTHAVLEGQGEPLFNPHILPFINSLPFGDTARIATTAPEKPLIKFIENAKKIPDINKKLLQIQISANEATDEDRIKIMPGVIGSLKRAYELVQDLRSIGIEACANYVLIKGLNDSPKKLEKHVRNCKGKFDFIRFQILNEFRDLEPSEPEKIDLIVEICSSEGMKYKFFKPAGKRLAGGCGQLKGGRN